MVHSTDDILKCLAGQFSSIQFLETKTETTGRFDEKHVIIFEYTNIADEPCVLKFFSLQHIREEAQKKEKTDLLEEFRIIKKFNSHPNVVRVYDANELRRNGRLIGFYITMEKFEATLSNLIAEKQTFSNEQVKQFLAQMDRVLYKAHYELEQPIVHSDIKPANIGIRRAGNGDYQYALMDFDVSVSLERKSTSGHSFTLSNKASLRGITLAYAPPEQAMAYLHRSGDISNRVDVYAVGAIAMQMLTGIAPQKNESQVYYKLPFDRLSADWKQVFERLCAPDVKHRSRRVADAVKTNGKALPPPGDGHRTQVVRPRSGHRRQALAYPGHRSNKKSILVVAIAICTVVLLGLVYVHFTGQDSQPPVAQAEQEQLVPVLPESEQETEQTSISEEETRTAQTTRPETGRLTLQLKPADAQVTIDGEPIETDGPIDLAAGTYWLQVARSGFTSYEEQIEIEHGSTVELPIELIESVGGLAFSVVPAGAQAVLRNASGQVVSRWNGNRTMSSLPVGSYRLQVRADGHEPYSTQLQIRQGEQRSFPVTLAAQTGSLAVNVTPSTARVTLTDSNGNQVNQWAGNQSIEDLFEGTYQLMVSADGYEAYEDVIEVERNSFTESFISLEEIISVQQSNESSFTDNFLTLTDIDEAPKLIGSLGELQRQIRYPEMARRANIEGRVYVQFIVNERGEVEDPRVIRGIGGGADEEALRVVSQARFTPGMQRGRPVRVQYSLPIFFRLQ